MNELNKEVYAFYSMYSWIFEYLEREFGRKVLEKYWKHIGMNYYSRLIEDIKKRGLIALEDYYIDYFGDEDSKEEARISRDENMFKIEINDCNAIKWLKEQKIQECAFCQDSYYRDYCDHCKFINKTLADQTGLTFEIKYNKNGKCTQIYKKIGE